MKRRSFDWVRDDMRVRMQRLLDEWNARGRTSRRAPVKQAKKRKPTCLHWKSGHWRNVACGEQWTRHRRKWIDRFQSGSADSPPTPATMARWLRDGIMRGVFRDGQERAA